MNPWKVTANALGILALAAALACPAKAADQLKMTYGFFMAPTEIPGGRTLPAGLYAFKLVDESPSNKVIQIFTSVLSGSLPPSGPPKPMQLAATIIAVPDYHDRPGNLAVSFYQARGGGITALKTITFAPDPLVLAVVYTHARAAEIAKTTNQPVASMATDPTADVGAMKNMPLTATTASGQDTDVPAAFGKPGDTTAGQRGGAGPGGAGANAETGQSASTVPSVPGVYGVDVMAGGKIVVLH